VRLRGFSHSLDLFEGRQIISQCFNEEALCALLLTNGQKLYAVDECRPPIYVKSIYLSGSATRGRPGGHEYAEQIVSTTWARHLTYPYSFRNFKKRFSLIDLFGKQPVVMPTSLTELLHCIGATNKCVRRVANHQSFRMIRINRRAPRRSLSGGPFGSA